MARKEDRTHVPRGDAQRTSHHHSRSRHRRCSDLSALTRTTPATTALRVPGRTLGVLLHPRGAQKLVPPRFSLLFGFLVYSNHFLSCFICHKVSIERFKLQNQFIESRTVQWNEFCSMDGSSFHCLLKCPTSNGNVVMTKRPRALFLKSKPSMAHLLRFS